MLHRKLVIYKKKKNVLRHSEINLKIINTEAKTSWIMPFTAGGFLHIALVTVLPDLLKETNPMESMKQFSALIAGIGVMAAMTILFEH